MKFQKIIYSSFVFFIVISLMSINDSDDVKSQEYFSEIGYLPLIIRQDNTPSVEGCLIFPANNIWNTRIDQLPLDPNSDAYVTSIGKNTEVHPDFGTVWEGAPIGIPYNVVSASQPYTQITFEYASESDPGPYPIPDNPLIEGGPSSDGDRHILIIEKDNCILYEIYNAYPLSKGSWQAGSGAIFDLKSNLLRPDTWTSADAAGLPIFPGLVRYDEVSSGKITHALRFTANNTRNQHIWPTRHDASSLTNQNIPPMGQRFRLKSSFDISGFSPQVQVILIALKEYGMFLSDNGSNWYISGVPDPRWNDDMLVNELSRVKGLNFEAVMESQLMADPNSGQVK